MPGDPQGVTAWRRTGATRYRVNWRGKVLLQVELSRIHGRRTPFGFVPGRFVEACWRDATVVDLDLVLSPPPPPPLSAAGKLCPHDMAWDDCPECCH